MECGVAMFAGNWWRAADLGRVRLVVTAAVTFAAARRHPGPDPLPLSPSMKSGACRPLEELSRRIDSMERPPRLTPPGALRFR